MNVIGNDERFNSHCLTRYNWWRDLYSGDIAALLASGWSVKKVALVNFFSACTVLLGLYIGIPVSTALDAESWILGAAMGMFSLRRIG